MPWYRRSHWRILIALGFGLCYGVVAAYAGWQDFTAAWIAPFGTIFFRLLLLVAVPLVLASLVSGIASLSDLNELSRIGGKTIAIYLATTLVALLIGLTLVNVLNPGSYVPGSVRLGLQQTYASDVTEREQLAVEATERGPLQPLVDMVPENMFFAASDNRRMLNVVFIALLLGVALILVPNAKAAPLLALFESLDAVIIKIVELVILAAPIGVFGLIADTVTRVAGDSPADVPQLLGALGFYSLTVLVGLAIQIFFTYALLVRLLTPLRLRSFFAGVAQAQLVAFSTSSSAATLPVSMKSAKNHLGISDEVSSFVLPLGATINMDGTGLYQAIAAVFIAQTLGIPLDLFDQLTIVLLALLASIGTAAVPSAGVVMLVVILETIGIPATGIALILGVDRFLDMSRTAANVTGDITVAAVVAAMEGQLDTAVASGGEQA
ncbi:MAG: dicarboxylate/amino acid:cation symporter [Acidobacteria bacterium]|nr:dicarboxylate/amino acid:cation symporter [Acidobacteriota bacterium]|tara:strand:+ start:561 stop:1874 length:1314 start_codon:yes stop_codon:yes gene_type:complete